MTPSDIGVHTEYRLITYIDLSNGNSFPRVLHESSILQKECFVISIKAVFESSEDLERTLTIAKFQTQFRT